MSAGDGIFSFECMRGRNQGWTQVVALFVALIATSRVVSGASLCPGPLELENLLSRYEIVRVEKFRGGLTPREEAEAAIGLDVVILEDVFRIGEAAIQRPTYRLQCHPVPTTEGSVDRDRWSNFYGFHTDRRFIQVFSVYESDSSENPKYRFEVISPDELWRMFDGWLFALRKTDSSSQTRQGPRTSKDAVRELPETP